MGVVEAAREMKRPVIAQVSVRTVQYYGAATLRRMADEALERFGSECFLHLDHCRDDTIIEAACAAHFDGFMIDASDLSYEGNVRRTREWVRQRRTRDVVVEGELGQIHGVEEDISGGADSGGPTLEQCQQFAADTGIDLLGADIGTAHGLYVSPPAVRFSFIEELVARISAGFVIHGGSGLDNKTLNILAGLRVAKINFSTELKIAWGDAVVKAIEKESVPEPLSVLQHAHEIIKNLAVFKLRALDGGGRSL